MTRYILHGVGIIVLFSIPVYITSSLGSIAATVGLIILACILYIFSIEVSPNSSGESKNSGRTRE